MQNKNHRDNVSVTTCCVKRERQSGNDVVKMCQYFLFESHCYLYTQGSICQFAITAFRDGIVRNRPERTNADQDPWHHRASLGHITVMIFPVEISHGCKLTSCICYASQRDRYRCDEFITFRFTTSDIFFEFVQVVSEMDQHWLRPFLRIPI